MRNILIKSDCLILFTLICISSCDRSSIPDNHLSRMHSIVNSTEINRIITDSVELELSQISEELQIVRLETSESVILGNIYTVLAGDNHIIIGTERNFYLFDRKGKYIRKLFLTGRGPEEFIAPIFSKVILNDILYISDYQKNKKYVYSFNLNTGIQNKILKANEELITSLIPCHDSSLLTITLKSISFKPPYSYSHGFTLIKQDLSGNILSEIPLGVHTGKWPFLFSDFSILKDKDGILITSPECDSVLRLSGNELFSVWRNIFKAKYGDELSEKKSLKVNMVNYSEDTILLSESISEYRGNTRFWGKVHLLLMDRSSNKLSVLKRLYFKENWFPINVLGLNLINNGKFAVVLQPADVDRILRSKLYRESVLNIMFPDSSAVTRSISDFDNQFVLLGKFR